MTIEQHTCITIACNICGETFTDEESGGIPHFDTIPEARDFQDAWDEDYRWTIRDDGYAVCPACDEKHDAARAALAPKPPVVQVPGQQEIPAVPDPDDDAASCRDCGTWPCARHATNEDRAEYQQATGSDAGVPEPGPRDFWAGDIVEIHDRDETYNGKTGIVVLIDEGDGEFPIGLDVEGFLGLVWCKPSEIRHAEPAAAESGAER